MSENDWLYNFTSQLAHDADLARQSSIRLLSFCGSTDFKNDELIECTLESVHINLGLLYHHTASGPKYAAISYTWGNPKPARIIRVNGTDKPVAENCFWVLHQIRRLALFDYYWIDAICIDQDNESEKTQQVKMMDRIYSHAQCTLICFGADRQAAEIFRKVRACERLNATIESILQLQHLSRHRKSSTIGFPHHSAMELWTSLAKNPYWRRLWIVQEILLSRNILILAGSVTVEWELFRRAWLRLDQARLKSGKDIPLIESIKAMDQLFRMSMIPRIGSSQLTLVDCINSFGKALCSNPKDKVLGFQALGNKGPFNQSLGYGSSLCQLLVKFASGVGQVDDRSAVIGAFHMLLTEWMPYLRESNELERFMADRLTYLFRSNTNPKYARANTDAELLSLDHTLVAQSSKYVELPSESKRPESCSNFWHHGINMVLEEAVTVEAGDLWITFEPIMNTSLSVICRQRATPAPIKSGLPMARGVNYDIIGQHAEASQSAATHSHDHMDSHVSGMHFLLALHPVDLLALVLMRNDTSYPSSIQAALLRAGSYVQAHTNPPNGPCVAVEWTELDDTGSVARNWDAENSYGHTDKVPEQSGPLMPWEEDGVRRLFTGSALDQSTRRESASRAETVPIKTTTWPEIEDCGRTSSVPRPHSEYDSSNRPSPSSRINSSAERDDRITTVKRPKRRSDLAITKCEWWYLM